MRRHGRRYFLSDIPVDEAIGKFHEALDACGALGRTASEEVSLEEALGRVTARAVWAEASSPHYDSAAMDGVAVRSRETTGATEDLAAQACGGTAGRVGGYGRPDAGRIRRRDHGGGGARG